MKKAILGLLALGLPIAALAATGERDFEHGRMGINARTMESNRDFQADRSADSARRAEIVTARTTHESHVTATSGAHGAVAAPEIDPTSAVSGLMLLLGGIAVLRGRKSRAI